MDGPRRRARRYFAPVLADVGLYEVWKTVQRVLMRAASLEEAMDAMLRWGNGTFVTEAEVCQVWEMTTISPVRRSTGWTSADSVGFSCCGFFTHA